MNNNLITLEWDSSFFGFPVSQLKRDSIRVEDLRDIYCNTDARLIYYFTSQLISEEIFKNSYFSAKLVDTKIAIHKPLKIDARLHPKVEIYEDEKADERLLQLALTAGTHSRFFKDDNISHSKAKELYEIWIDKSVQRIMADIVLVYRENNKIIGFITINTKEDQPHVSLLAVDPLHEGKGVSFALMNSMEWILFQKGYKIVKSETQAQNKKALSIYRRQGVEFGEQHYIYHLWRNNSLDI